MDIIRTIKGFRSILDYGKIIQVVVSTLTHFFDEVDRIWPNTPAA